jgi:hypothetical protein
VYITQKTWTSWEETSHPRFLRNGLFNTLKKWKVLPVEVHDGIDHRAAREKHSHKTGKTHNGKNEEKHIIWKPAA